MTSNSTTLDTEPATDRRREHVHRVRRLLDALCRHHRRTEARLYRLSGPAFREACQAMRRFWKLRDMLRVRIFAARCEREPCRRTLRALEEDWRRFRRASTALERTMGAAGPAMSAD